MGGCTCATGEASDMPALEDVWAEALGGLIVVVVLAAIGWMWIRRRKPLEWAAAGGMALDEHARRHKRANHAERVGWVRQRAEILKLPRGHDLPVSATGRNPVVVTFHPTGRRQAYYRDLPSYKSAVERGDVNPVNALPGKPPQVLSRWSDEELRSWLSDHADDLPPSDAAA